MTARPFLAPMNFDRGRGDDQFELGDWMAAAAECRRRHPDTLSGTGRTRRVASRIFLYSGSGSAATRLNALA